MVMAPGAALQRLLQGARLLPTGAALPSLQRVELRWACRLLPAALAACCLLLGAWCLLLAAWCLVLGAWCLLYAAVLNLSWSGQAAPW
jgi:hypothetical protein